MIEVLAGALQGGAQRAQMGGAGVERTARVTQAAGRGFQFMIHSAKGAHGGGLEARHHVNAQNLCRRRFDDGNGNLVEEIAGRLQLPGHRIQLLVAARDRG